MTNNDRNNDTIRTGIMKEVAYTVARIWKQHIYPLPFERTWTIDGVKVVVIVCVSEPTNDEKGMTDGTKNRSTNEII